MQFPQAPQSRSLTVNPGAQYPYLPKTKTPNQFAMGKPENRFDFT